MEQEVKCLVKIKIVNFNRIRKVQVKFLSDIQDPFDDYVFFH